jgi:hypothetical protein
VKVLVIERRLGEAGVVVGHEGRQEGVAGHGADAGEPEFLHQAVLRGFVGALDASLAWLELAQMISIVNAFSARPNWVMPSP